jgi:hypothetical protein
MSLLNKLKTNWKVLEVQWRTFRASARVDRKRARLEWQEGDYWAAIHSFTLGPRGEFYQNAWRWVMYRDTLLELLLLGLILEWLGVINVVTLTVSL